MESIESLKDYLIADEIIRIESLSREEVVRELVNVNVKKIESLKDLREVMEKKKKKSTT